MSDKEIRFTIKGSHIQMVIKAIVVIGTVLVIGWLSAATIIGYMFSGIWRFPYP